LTAPDAEPSPAVPAAERRSPERLAHDRGERVRTTALVIVAIAAATALLYFGRNIFIPLFLALVFTALLRPLVRWLEHVRVPTMLAGTLVVLLALGALFGAGLAVTAPVQDWIKEAPHSISIARHKLRKLTRSVEPVAGALQGAASGTGGRSGTSGGGGAAQHSSDPAVPNVASKLFGATTAIIGGFVEVLLLTWFLLASGNLFPRKLLRVLPLPWEKQAAVDVLGETESVVSGYMFVSLLINIVQGAAVALVMWLIGMPTPVLWGMMTVLVEFVPYLGAAFMMLVLALVGLANFSSTLHALAPPGAYLVITTLQNNLVSPVTYGRRLKLNPVAVLVSVMIWFELWGVPGAFLAVPIVATAKVLGDRLDGLAAIGEFLGE
jgi:predicted PurR-regulated permease PerM